MKMTNTTADQLNKLNILLIGDSGVGKTTSIETLPQKGTLVATRERSTLPLRHKRYEVCKLECWEDLRQLALWFANPDSIEDEQHRKLIQETKVLVIDSLSECGRLCRQHLLTVDRPTLQAERSDGKRTSPKGVGSDTMTLDEWGVYAVRMDNLMSAFVQLPVHIIFMCGEERKVDGVQEIVTVDLGGKKLPNSCPKHFDIVMNMHADATDSKKRVWQTYNDGRILAKDSTNLLDGLEETNWTKLFTKVFNTTKTKEPTK